MTPTGSDIVLYEYTEKESVTFITPVLAGEEVAVEVYWKGIVIYSIYVASEEGGSYLHALKVAQLPSVEDDSRA